MSETVWSFYDAASGAFARSRVMCSAGANLDANTPAGHVAIAGAFDPLSQRMNLVTGQVEDYIPDAPADTDLATYAWDADSKRWVGTPTLAALKVTGCDAIDAAAGDARRRYITDIPGQDQTYEAKREQAASYAAAVAIDPQAPVPSYIAAEAAALTQTPAAVAAAITAEADDWNETINPAIEAARLGGKAAVNAAADASAVAAARDAAIAALAVI